MPVNLVLLQGVLSPAPDIRILESGSHLATFAMRVPNGTDKATSVPVRLWEPPSWFEDLEDGEELIVLGTVQRRFFRTRDAGVGARVAVEAEVVGRLKDKRKLNTVIRRVQQALDETVVA